MRYIDRVSGDRVIAALEELQAERNALLDHLQAMQREVEIAARQVNKLNEAIQALIGLRPELVAADSGRDAIRGRGFAQAELPGFDSPHPELIAAFFDVPPGPERLRPFVTPGGDGKNLQSAQMVAAVVEALGNPVRRDQLQREFFDYFGSELLSEYWQQPEKAFRTALRRAMERELIVALEPENGGEHLYMTRTSFFTWEGSKPG